MLQRKFHLDGTALRIHRRCDGEHARCKTLAGKGIGHYRGLLPRLQLVQKTFIHLGHQLGGPCQRQAEQGLAGLHDLPGLDRAHQHAGIGWRDQSSLRQAGLGRHGGRLGQRQLRLRLHHIGTGIGIGLHLRLRAELLRPRHIHRPAGLVELRGAVEPLGHQLLHPRQAGVCGL